MGLYQDTDGAGYLLTEDVCGVPVQLYQGIS